MHAPGTPIPRSRLDSFVAIGELFEYFQQLIAARRAEPRNDMLSVLTTAEVDGDRLTDEDLLNFAFLLLVAGNETTRNLIALGTLALIEHPDECSRLVADPTLIPSAVEEMLRWTSPVTHMARAATRDVEIRGQRIREGDMVVMLYGSANRDEEIFGSDAEEFKITRHPNPHIAFGCGEHRVSALSWPVSKPASSSRCCSGDTPSSNSSATSTGCGPRWCPVSSECPCDSERRADHVPGLHTGAEGAARGHPRLPGGGDDAGADRRGRRPDGGRGSQGVRARARRRTTCSASAGRKNMADGGLTALEQFIFFEEAQRVNAPIPLVTLNTVGPTLVQCGTDEQKQKFLPAILAGTVEFAIGYSEPSAGSDLASLRTTAVRDGDDYIINGAEDVHQRRGVRRLHLAGSAHRSERQEAQGHIDLHRADIHTGLLVEAAAHHARRVHLLHVL